MNQRGMVLPLTLMFVLVLTTLSVALLTVGGHETQIAANHLKGVHALFLAEAGLEDAFNTFRNDTTLLLTASSSLTTLSSVACTADSSASACSTLKAYGGYSVQYQSAGSNTVRVVVTGYTGTSGSQTSQRVLRAILTIGFTSNDAVRTNDDLKISGNAKVLGTCGSVHTNDDLEVGGNSAITSSATASDDYKKTGNAVVGAGSGGDEADKDVPTVTASNFLSQAKATVAASEIYQFMSDGRVLDGGDNLVTAAGTDGTLASGQTYRGWTYNSSGPKWDFSGNTAYDGTYYFQGDVKTSGNPGSVLTPWNVTIIATGDIEMSGNPDLNVHSIDTLLASEGDVKISGNFTMYEAGAIALGGSLDLSGNPTIIGSIIGGGSGENKISGNPTITYNCGLAPPVIADLTILAAGF